mmetsp:Transcript_2486/g.7334  ORF Transcript_2486/g.7334 Transcript_2486/m.7334 type:complete len:242 (+) Transcript_2486:1704-2429(+)
MPFQQPRAKTILADHTRHLIIHDAHERVRCHGKLLVRSFRLLLGVGPRERRDELHVNNILVVSHDVGQGSELWHGPQDKIAVDASSEDTQAISPFQKKHIQHETLGGMWGGLRSEGLPISGVENSEFVLFTDGEDDEGRQIFPTQPLHKTVLTGHQLRGGLQALRGYHRDTLHALKSWKNLGTTLQWPHTHHLITTSSHQRITRALESGEARGSDGAHVVLHDANASRRFQIPQARLLIGN